MTSSARCCHSQKCQIISKKNFQNWRKVQAVLKIVKTFITEGKCMLCGLQLFNLTDWTQRRRYYHLILIYQKFNKVVLGSFSKWLLVFLFFWELTKQKMVKWYHLCPCLWEHHQFLLLITVCQLCEVLHQAPPRRLFHPRCYQRYQTLPGRLEHEKINMQWINMLLGID